MDDVRAPFNYAHRCPDSGSSSYICQESFSKIRTAGSFRYSINSNFYNKTAKISLKLIQILRLGRINYTHTLFTCLGCDKLLRD